MTSGVTPGTCRRFGSALLVRHGAVNHRAVLDQLPNVLMAGHAELAIVLPRLLGEIRAVRVVALLTIAGGRRVYVPGLLVPLHPGFVADRAKRIALRHKQVRLPGRVGIVAQNARAHRHRSMQMLLLHESVIGMALQAQVLGRIGAQQLLELALMRIVAVHAATLFDRLVDLILQGQHVTGQTQSLFRVTQMEFVRGGSCLGMTRAAHALGHRPVNERFGLQVRMTAEISAPFPFHVGRRRDSSAHHRCKQKEANSANHKPNTTAPCSYEVPYPPVQNGDDTL